MWSAMWQTRVTQVRVPTAPGGQLKDFSLPPSSREGQAQICIPKRSAYSGCFPRTTHSRACSRQQASPLRSPRSSAHPAAKGPSQQKQPPSLYHQGLGDKTLKGLQGSLSAWRTWGYLEASQEPSNLILPLGKFHAPTHWLGKPWREA